MKSTFTSRVFAAILMGCAFGTYIHHSYVKQLQLGRDAYLAHQAQHFQKFVAVPQPVLQTVIGAVMVIGLFLAMYECLAHLLERVLIAMNPEEQSGVL